MAKTLYIYLKGGRGDAKVTEIWDGAAPTEEGMVDGSGVIVGTAGKEVADPYRDIFESTHVDKTYVGWTQNGVPQTPIDQGGAVSNLYPTDGSTPTSPSGVSRISDDVEHVPPRQYYKVYTWLVFEDTDGAVYKFRKADLIGWGSFPRR